MDSIDSSDFTVPSGNPHLLSESPLFPSHSTNTGPGGDDLSISELSLNVPKPGPSRKRFSLFAQPPDEESIAKEGDDGVEGEDEEEEAAEDREKRRRLAARTREEKLQHDLFILRQLNASFATYNDALREAKTSTEIVSAQLEQTNVLLDKYGDLLAKSHSVAGLIFDEKWEGADVDQDVLEREMEEAEASARKKEEELALAAQRDRERREREEKERIEREERELVERQKRENSASRGTVRGVRGTRASMRGVRGSTRGVTSTGLRAPSVTGRGTASRAITTSRSSPSLSRGSTTARGGRWS